MNRSYYKHTAVITILITGADDVASGEPFVNYEQDILQNKLVVMHLKTFIPLFHKVTEKKPARSFTQKRA
jgi:hypothetical protein